MRGADLRQRVVSHYEIIVAAERGIRHYRHIVLGAPWQKVTFNATVVETVSDLVGRAEMAVRNTEQVFHLARIEVGYTQARIFFAARSCSNAATTPENCVLGTGECNK